MNQSTLNKLIILSLVMEIIGDLLLLFIKMEGQNLEDKGAAERCGFEKKLQKELQEIHTEIASFKAVLQNSHNK